MTNVLLFPNVHLPTPASLPTVLVSPLIDAMARTNHVSRTVRQLGYKVTGIDIRPDDGGSPIIQIDLAGLSDRSLMLLSQCAVRNRTAGYDRVTIDQVRVSWAWSA